MKKLFLALSFLCFSSHFVLAQKTDLLIKKNEQGLYLEHKVSPKESFFSIGRLYNVDPKLLAAFNKLDMNKGLQIDQEIRIPLTASNFNQQGNHGTPVYYKVVPNDGLLSISNANNKVRLVKLREWNGLKDDKIQAGKKMIIGFLQTKEMPSVTIKTTPEKEEPVTKTEVIPEKKNPVVEETRPVGIKEEKMPAAIVEKIEEPATVKTEMKSVYNGQGYFKSFFDQQSKVIPITKEETVTSGIFKTTSGWLDAKYYLLMDLVSPGTIVRIINPDNNKAVYAKVLGKMSGILQNSGLDIRISNAAAAVLEITDEDKFIVKLNY